MRIIRSDLADLPFLSFLLRILTPAWLFPHIQTNLFSHAFSRWEIILGWDIFPPLECWELIHAFVSSRWAYCNSRYACLSQGAAARLQLLQNTAAHLLTKRKHREHITPTLASLHYLPAEFSVKYKTLVITYRGALRGEVHGTWEHFWIVWACTCICCFCTCNRE